ncbi:WhiB family transcriptional regulator [Yinghuangia soli]|uniref:Transcriptional regulator WhiB n=1 Tax=Yinghuangia soli TaxID=2908204 RepID=A0AA41PXT1_9ACTN|nr:WhiB family transcriptional regulator [Yinghuangia soli]MCF2527181.1 WhiB family transcriptional regulator [Yinghuangia soli]
MAGEIPVMGWMGRAACRGTDPRAFEDTEPDTRAAASVKAALKVCRGCPVLAVCRDWSMDTRQPQGVWGGMTTRERERARSARVAVRRAP